MKPVDPRLLRAARAARVHLFVCVAVGVVTAMLIVVQAELLADGISRIVGGADRGAISGTFAALAAVFAGRAAVSALQDAAAQRAAAAVTSDLRRQVVAHAARLPTTEARRSQIATLVTRGIDALDPYLGRYLPQLALAVVVPLAVLARILAADRTAGVTVLLTLPLIPVFMVLIGLATEASNAKRWRALQRLSHHFLDVVSGLPTLLLFGRAKAQPAAVREVTERYRTTTMATLRISFLSSLVLELVATLSVALVAVGVGLRLVDGGLDLRTSLLVIVLAPEAYLPLRRVGAEYHAAAEGVAAADEVFGVLGQPLPPAGGDRAVPPLGGAALRVDGVSVLRPGRAAPTPAGVDLVAPWGAVTVLTGPSGAGKSTLLAVLLGTVAPDEGQVSIVGPGEGCGSTPAADGATVAVALGDLDLGEWRERLAWVDQRPFLFAGSVADNVRLSRPDATDDDVAAALAAAGLDPSMAARTVGERGVGLSSGEGRRVAVARAVLRRAEVVLLDEPTAGLDLATEAELLATIRRLAASAIVVMASHRPAAIAIADHVVEVQGATAPLLAATA